MSRSRAPRPDAVAPPSARAKVGARDFHRRAGQLRPKPRATRAVRRRARRSPRELLRAVPTAAWLCALVALASATAWSFITPALQVPDEPEHVAYVKQLAETGHLPSHEGKFSLEEEVALRDLRLQTVAEQPENQTISSRAQEQTLQHELEQVKRVAEPGSQYAGVAASQPPLYYALEAIPYTLGEGGTLLDRIALMRLLSAVMAGLTALFTYLFVREALPRVPWAWTVGGLGVALVPLLGFMSGAVNPDSMLYAVTAAVFYCLARAFHRGLTRSSALILGAVIAVGLMTKLNFAGIAPGALLGLIVLSVRAARTLGRAAYASLALALAIALSPVALYVAGHIADGAPPFGIVSHAVGAMHGPLNEISYIWELYLPRLPGMPQDFGGVFTTQQIWFKGYVGLYGWLDTTFPAWVYDLALAPAAAIAILCLRSVAVSFPGGAGSRHRARRVPRHVRRAPHADRRRLLPRVLAGRRRIRTGSVRAAAAAAARAGARPGGTRRGSPLGPRRGRSDHHPVPGPRCLQPVASGGAFLRLISAPRGGGQRHTQQSLRGDFAN